MTITVRNNPETMPTPEPKEFSVMTATMETEIFLAEKAGIEVTVGGTPDLAYDQPGEIRKMLRFLDAQNEQLKTIQATTSKRRIGANALSKVTDLWPAQKRKRLKALDGKLEVLRDKLLYDDCKGGPWHGQRGCATALITITAASELRAPNSDGIYDTMGAMLPSTLSEHVFDHRCPELAGQSVRDAIISTERKFNKRKAADSYADHKLEKLDTFLNAEITDEFKDIVVNCTDSLGIRSRGVEVGAKIHEHAQEALDRDPSRKEKEFLMMSFGCGTALPMLEVAKEMKEQGWSKVKLILIDQDPIALAAATELADQMGLGDDIEVHCKKLFSKLGKPIDMETVLDGRLLDVSEDSGLREYLPDKIYRDLTAEAWKHLAEGGLMTTGNMNTNRPQKKFLHGLMGWVPRVTMRTIGECINLHRAAGVPRDATKVRVTRDGVYSLYFSQKPYSS